MEDHSNGDAAVSNQKYIDLMTSSNIAEAIFGTDPYVSTDRVDLNAPDQAGKKAHEVKREMRRKISKDQCCVPINKAYREKFGMEIEHNPSSDKWKPVNYVDRGGVRMTRVIRAQANE